MQVENMKTGAATGDGLNNLAGRTLVKNQGLNAQDAAVVARAPGLYDPSSRVSLSVDAMLFLSRSKKVPERQPALTAEEWKNNLTPSLAARELNAFGKYAETGDHKGYYRAYIEYYDGLRPEDQNSPRYFGTREVAVAGLRSLEYSDRTDTGEQPQFKTLVDMLLDSEKLGTDVSGEGDADDTGINEWDVGQVTYAQEETSEDGLSNIQKLYSEIF